MMTLSKMRTKRLELNKQIRKLTHDKYKLLKKFQNSCKHTDLAVYDYRDPWDKLVVRWVCRDCGLTDGGVSSDEFGRSEYFRSTTPRVTETEYYSLYEMDWRERKIT
jgi:hypothetical protein